MTRWVYYSIRYFMPWPMHDTSLYLGQTEVSNSKRIPLTIPHWHLQYMRFFINLMEQNLRYDTSNIGIGDLSSSWEAHNILETSSCLLFNPRRDVPLLIVLRRYCNLVKIALAERPEILSVITCLKESNVVLTSVLACCILSDSVTWPLQVLLLFVCFYFLF